MTDRMNEILGLPPKPSGVKKEARNGWSSRDPSLESISEIQINPPVCGPETEARLEQNRGMIPEEAIAAFRRAGEYLSIRNYGRAVSDYTRAIEYSPRSTESYYNRGIAHEKAGKLSKAVEDYSGAIEADPQYVRAYCNRASLLWSLGEKEWAVDDMKIAARLGHGEMQRYLKSKGIEW